MFCYDYILVFHPPMCCVALYTTLLCFVFETRLTVFSCALPARPWLRCSTAAGTRRASPSPPGEHPPPPCEEEDEDEERQPLLRQRRRRQRQRWQPRRPKGRRPCKTAAPLHRRQQRQQQRHQQRQRLRWRREEIRARLSERWRVQEVAVNRTASERRQRWWLAQVRARARAAPRRRGGGKREGSARRLYSPQRSCGSWWRQLWRRGCSRRRSLSPRRRGRIEGR